MDTVALGKAIEGARDTARGESPPSLGEPGWLLQPGDTINHYTVTGPLGQGGFGQVFRVANPDGRPFALKVMRLQSTLGQLSEAEKKMGRRMADEARNMARVDHINVVRFQNMGLSDERRLVWIAMEYLEGVTLRSLMQQGRVPLGVERILHFAEQLARGLSAIHAHGIVHRDIKPENVMIMQGDLAKLIDFGIAKSDQSRIRTTRANPIGTAAYMAPDYLSNEGERASSGWDIYALGVVILELLLGHHPFQLESGNMPTLALVVTRHLHQRMPRLCDLVPTYPKSLSDLIADATEPDPGQRLALASDMADRLKDIRLTWRAAHGESPVTLRPSDVEAAFRSAPAPISWVRLRGGTRPIAQGGRGATVPLAPALPPFLRRAASAGEAMPEPDSAARLPMFPDLDRDSFVDAQRASHGEASEPNEVGDAALLPIPGRPPPQPALGKVLFVGVFAGVVLVLVAEMLGMVHLGPRRVWLSPWNPAEPRWSIAAAPVPTSTEASAAPSTPAQAASGTAPRAAAAPPSPKPLPGPANAPSRPATPPATPPASPTPKPKRVIPPDPF